MYIPTGDVKIKVGNVDPYWGRRTLWLTMVLYICTRYVVVKYSAVDPYWGRFCRKVYKCISLLETLRKNMAMFIPTGDVGPCGKLWCCISVLGTLLFSIALWILTGDVDVEKYTSVYPYWRR